MGKQIVYCSDCGNGLREDDFGRGKAGMLEQRPYCVPCRPEAATATPRTVKPVTERIPLATLPRPASTRRLLPPSRTSASPLGLALGMGGALLVVALAFAASGRRPPAPAEVVPKQAPAPERLLPAPQRPAPALPPVPAASPALPEVDPTEQLSRWLEDIERLIQRDTEQLRTAEIRAMLEKASSLAGPRRGEVERRKTLYEQSLLEPVRSPEPVRAPTGPTVLGFTLINADTDLPVSGFDPIPEGAVIDLSTLGTRNIDFRANTAPARVPAVKLTLDKAAPRLEKGWPYALSENDGSGKVKGFTPSPGAHTLNATLWPNKEFKGPPGHSLTLHFTIR